MGDCSRTLLIGSGIGAFLLYCSIVFFLVFGIFPVLQIKYIPRAETSLEKAISIDVGEIVAEKQEQRDSGTPLEGSGIRDMFSSIPDMAAAPKQSGDDRSENAKNTKDRDNSSKIESLQRKLESIKSNLDTLGNKTLDVQSQSISPELADGEYDEWFGKIYDIIYRKWRPVYYQNARVTVLLQITNTGELRYRVAYLSEFEEYNQNVINFLESLKDEKFPPYPKGRVVEIKVNFSLK